MTVKNKTSDRRLAGRVAIVTGGAGALGRAHALRLAAEGASVVVNDLGCDLGGVGSDDSRAAQVVQEIRAAGGAAIISGHDVSDWAQAEAMVQLAIETFGGLHILVNNAGIVRDRLFANMSEAEWDAVIAVHLKGHAAPSRAAVSYWRAEAKAGRGVDRSIIHTSSLSGYRGSFGQANYSAAKLAVVGLSRVIALEGASIGVRSNTISPAARSRLGESAPGVVEILKKHQNADFDYFDPANVSALVAWLAGPDCPATEQIYHIGGNDLFVFSLPPITQHLKTEGQWSLEELDRVVPQHLVKTTIEQFFPE